MFSGASNRLYFTLNLRIIVCWSTVVVMLTCRYFLFQCETRTHVFDKTLNNFQCFNIIFEISLNYDIFLRSYFHFFLPLIIYPIWYSKYIMLSMNTNNSFIRLCFISISFLHLFFFLVLCTSLMRLLSSTLLLMVIRRSLSHCWTEASISKWKTG